MFFIQNRKWAFWASSTLFVLYLFLGFYGIVSATSLNGLYEKSYKTSILEGTYTNRALDNIMNIESSLKDVLLSQDEVTLRAAMNEVNVYGLLTQSDFSRLSTIDTKEIEDNNALFQDVKEYFGNYEVMKDTAYLVLNKGDMSGFKTKVKEDLLPIISTIKTDLSVIVAGETEEVKRAYVQYSTVTRYTRIQLAVGIVLLVVFILYGAYLIRRTNTKTKEKIFKEQEELRITIDAIGEGVIVTDFEENIIKINKVAEELLGRMNEDVKGKRLEAVFQLEDEATHQVITEPYKPIFDREKESFDEYDAVLISSAVEPITISTSASVIKNIYGIATGAVIIFRNISERRKKEEEINYITFHDQVTGCFNRAFFEEQKNRLNSDKYLPCSVIQGDINGLKLVNDAFGHSRGDELLRNAAQILQKHCRHNDLIMRVGGDEFTIFLPNTENFVACQIVKNIETELCIQEENTQDNSIFISIALGFATRNHIDESLDTIIKKADESMYKKKLLEKKSLHSSVLKSIKSTLAEKSHETEAHATRLVELSRMMSDVLELPLEKNYELELLAALHDIGKIGISDQILNKPGPLTNEEWIEMKKHPEIGYRIAFSTTELSGIARYILCHHERWDGNGYPQGLAGSKIPLLSRIIAIIDSYDAMCDLRTYNKVRTPEEALIEIEKNAGTQFDPQLAEIFVAMMRDHLHIAKSEDVT